MNFLIKIHDHNFHLVRRIRYAFLKEIDSTPFTHSIEVQTDYLAMKVLDQIIAEVKKQLL